MFLEMLAEISTLEIILPFTKAVALEVVTLAASVVVAAILAEAELLATGNLRDCK